MSSTADAAAIVEDIALRLAEPHRVTLPGDALSLAEGGPGIALLYAQLAAVDPQFYRAAHKWLSVATRSGQHAPHAGLYHGVPALAFAVELAARTPREYSGAREHLARQMAEVTAREVRRARRVLEAPGQWLRLDQYDLVFGLTGLGGCLLRTGGHEPLGEILRFLVDLTRPVGDGRLPGWWVAQNRLTHEPVPVLQGHANLGMAHGVAGPLALLALAWEQGVQVPGHEEAVRRLAAWLLRWLGEDEAGPWWPEEVTWQDEGHGGLRPAAAARPTWCSGTPGMARALQLAGVALGEAGWCAQAVAALVSVFERPPSQGELEDPALCHGWAGLLHTTRRMAQDSGDEDLAARVPWLVGRVVDGFRADSEFGFPYGAGPSGPAYDWPGFLMGAAGVALALDGYARGGADHVGWDRVLLLG
ncbi:lanthionine synthetase C family protein [Streptomyces sp. NPDC053474]|uniref:lanthionine synthetase C family protein n=1 Tax=Streptomyces sp. NPDC053474 TaxID=3365704 RepID=UPI0037CF033F